ncbi:MAG TPA: MFS transporter [Jatrophihabitans sp.]|nr:MFS transporter [Jatrophihabitans sp.]
MRAPSRSGVFANRRFVLLASARTASVLGNGIGTIALAFGVLALPGATPGRLSLVLGALRLPQVLLVLFGGVIGDRLPRYRLMVGAEVVAGLGYGALAWMIGTGRAPLAGLLIAAAVAGSATAVFLPASGGVLPEIVEPAMLQSANGWLRMGQNTALVSGLFASGLLVAAVGAGWALAVDALSFWISAWLIGLMRVPARARVRTGSSWHDLRQGWWEFRSRQWLWVVVLQFTFLLAAVSAVTGVLGPLLADRELGGARAWAVLAAGQALGTVAGAGVATRIRPRHPIRVAVLASSLAAAPMLALGAGLGVWWALAAMIANGVAFDIFGVLWQTTLQRQIPEGMLSRVSAYDIFGSIALAPLGTLLAGPIAAAVGVHAALLGCGALALLSTAGALLAPEVRGLVWTASEPVPVDQADRLADSAG